MMPMNAPDADLEKLKARIQALRAKTVDNGCTEEEALSAAAKVAELLDRHDLSLSDIALREEACARAVFDTKRKRRAALEGCVTTIGDFCDCRVWRESNEAGTYRYVFFGLKPDVAVAEYLCAVVDAAMQTELLRFKVSKNYLSYARRDRAAAGTSFLHGMAGSIALKLQDMKAARDTANRGAGRDLVTVKHGIVEHEFGRLGLDFRTVAAGRRTVIGGAYDAGDAAGAALVLNPGLGR
jgi:hypothetical protein